MFGTASAKYGRMWWGILGYFEGGLAAVGGGDLGVVRGDVRRHVGDDHGISVFVALFGSRSGTRVARALISSAAASMESPRPPQEAPGGVYMYTCM